MSSIRTVITTVKNFVTNLVQSPQQEEAPNAEGYQQQVSRFGRAVFTRKRPAGPGTFYEPEITDDEDDTPGSFSFKCDIDNPKAKRIRIDFDKPEASNMSSGRGDQASPRYATRGSGIAPNIEGLQKQPWEFSFPSIRSKETVAVEGRFTMGGACGSSRKPPSSGASSGDSAGQNVEVITIDDEQPCSSKSMHLRAQKEVSPSKRGELDVIKPRFSGVMKGARQRDSNRFSRCLSTITQKLYGHGHSPAVRLKEKDKYKQLLMNYNILSNTGMYLTTSALTKSKVPPSHLQVMYNKFGPSPTHGAVTLRINNEQAFSSRRNEKQDFQSPADRSALVPLPRLFSTPQDFRSSPALPSTKAIAYEPQPPEPQIIDLEEEPCTSTKIESCISPITPVSNRRTYSSSTPVKSPVVGNFTNLDDALNKSILAEGATGKDESGASMLAIEDSQHDEVEDISILAEKIVNKSRSKPVNTLALENSSCPYVDRQWLDNSKSAFRENQRYRNERIRQEAETLKILKTESTLDKDLEERIRKKLTLREIIVLEEQPEQMPELTEEMMKVINYAKQVGNDQEVLAQVRLPKDTISITRGDARTLRAAQWLNDNVINTYMGLIVLRSKQDGYPSVYAFQTFFYPKLLKEGYSNQLKRWTRKDDIFAHDLIILPIHLGLHWCLACVDLRKKTIKYYDSLDGNNDRCLNVLLEYLSREMKERKQIDLNKEEWTLENVKGIPQQQNGSDCGMFSCKFAEYLSRDANFSFTQEHMPYYRDRMIYELITSQIMHP